MERGKIAWSFAASLVLILSIASLSLLELSAFHVVGIAFASAIAPITTTSLQSDGDDDYLEPCIGCTPTEEEYETLTTFELLAKYPELSGDPSGIETTTNQTEAFNLLDEEDAIREQSVEDSSPDPPRDLPDVDDSEGDADEEDDRSTRESESDDIEVEEESNEIEEECDASYPDVCIPPAPPDLDCGDIGQERFEVRGSDPHRFDGDDDGIGCEG